MPELPEADASEGDATLGDARDGGAAGNDGGDATSTKDVSANDSGCPSGFLACDAGCRPSDIQACGTCGNDCTQLANVTAAGLACNAGACSYKCAPGYADCAHSSAGCATNLTNDANNCGACGQACPAAKICQQGACTCAYTSFTLGPKLPFTQTGPVPDGGNPTFYNNQDAIMGASVAGDVVLYLSGSVCSINNLRVAVLVGAGAYTIYDVTTQAPLAGFPIGELSHTLSGDGRTIVMRTSDLRGFNAANFDPTSGIVSSVVVAPFALVTAALPAGASVAYPALSGDGLAFYYRVISSDATVDGLYESVRPNTAAAFPAGARMPANVQTFPAVTGISYDRLALFFSTTMFTRTSVSLPFTNPNGAGAPPVAVAFRVRPLGDCSLLGTCTPGGWPSEDICRITSP